MPLSIRLPCRPHPESPAEQVGDPLAAAGEVMSVLLIESGGRARG